MNQVFKNDVGEKDKGNKGGGILITGNSNLLGKDLSENDVFANTGIGIAVVGNTNTISKNDVGDKGKGNTGDGINVSGYGNVIDENNVFANGGDGIETSGGTAANPTSSPRTMSATGARATSATASWSVPRRQTPETGQWPRSRSARTG